MFCYGSSSRQEHPFRGLFLSLSPAGSFACKVGTQYAQMLIRGEILFLPSRELQFKTGIEKDPQGKDNGIHQQTLETDRVITSNRAKEALNTVPAPIPNMFT